MIQPKQSLRNLVRTGEKEPSRFFKLRMDRNERTHPFAESFIQHLRDELTGEMLMTYPEPEELYESFARWLHVGRDHLLFHSGSDLAIKAVFETYIEPHDRILLHAPGYAMYKVYADMFQAQVEILEYNPDLQFDFERFIAMILPGLRMVVIENPNGFVGNKHPRDSVAALIRKAHEFGILVLVDEAYFHFIDESAADLMDAFDNVIVVRTFSKAFGLAGLRAAYLLSVPENISNLYRVKPMHELNGMAIFVISALIKKEDEFLRFIRETGDSRRYLQAALRELEIQSSDSCTNFIAARFGASLDCVELAQHLKKSDFLIRRPFREKHLQEWLRVGTLPLEQEKLFIQKVKEYIALQEHTKKP